MSKSYAHLSFSTKVLVLQRSWYEEKCGIPSPWNRGRAGLSPLPLQLFFLGWTWDCKFSWTSHSHNLYKWNKVHSMGQKPQAAVGSKRATRTEENRFTALLSRMGFPAMYLTSFVGLLTTMPVLSSKPGVEKKQVRWKIHMTWFKTN